MNTKFKRSIFLSSYLLAMTAADPVTAAMIYVDAANQSGTEDGTLTYPYDTVGEALATAASGDIVSVAPGIYYGGFLLPAVPVSVVSQEGPEVTILDGMGNTYAMVNAANPPHVVDATFDGFTMANASYGVFAWTPWRTYNPPVVTVRNCILRNLGTGVRASILSTVTIENTVITNSNYDALEVIWGRSALFNNVTVDNAVRGIWAYQYPWPQMNNTTISNVDTAFSLNYNVHLTGSHNNVWNYVNLEQPVTTIPGILDITDTLFVDPLFVAPPDDYRLDVNSPLIDAGIDVGLPYVGSAPDIGAYEFTDLSLTERVDQLATSFAEAPLEIYRNPSEQRRQALYHKLMAVVNMIATLDNGQSANDKLRALNGALKKLQNDILSKVDGEHGGNPANDWIADPAEKTEFYEHVVELIDFVQAEIDAIASGLL